MLLIRMVEEKLDEWFSLGRLRGTCHLCAGQEAVCAAVGMNIQAHDLVSSTHRGHGHLLGMGGDPGRIVAEIMGRTLGYSSGVGGSQHMCSMENGFLGSNGITAGGVPVGTGAALGRKICNAPGISVVFLGDGATSQGVFYESLNLAAMWTLPVLYVCENNRYGMSMALERIYSNRLSAKADHFGIRTRTVDGMDFIQMDHAVADAVTYVRQTSQPFFMECQTYRYFGHSKSDRRVYRSKKEEDEWALRDPLNVLAAHFRENNVDVQPLVDAANQQLQNALDDAEKSPQPETNPPVFS